MTTLERKAFYDWDTCAIDRLVFLRAYKPGTTTKLYGSADEKIAILTNTAGERPSSVIEFTGAVRKYLEEKEAFTSQLIDYKADIDAVFDANSKIAALPPDAPPQDFVAALNSVLTDAVTLNSNYLAIRENIETKL
jgi:hypothetical protein